MSRHKKLSQLSPPLIGPQRESRLIALLDTLIEMEGTIYSSNLFHTVRRVDLYGPYDFCPGKHFAFWVKTRELEPELSVEVFQNSGGGGGVNHSLGCVGYKKLFPILTVCHRTQLCQLIAICY